MRITTIILFCAAPLFAALPSAFAEINPFSVFRGQYKVVSVECVRDGYLATGCDLSLLTIKYQYDRKTIELKEVTSDHEDSRIPYNGKISKPNGYKETSELSGDLKTIARWESDQVLPDGAIVKDVRIFSTEPNAILYHIAKTKRAPQGSTVTFKQTYTLKVIRRYN